MYEHYYYNKANQKARRRKNKGLRRILFLIGIGGFFSMCSDPHLGAPINELIEHERREGKENEELDALKKEGKEDKKENVSSLSKGGSGNGGGGGGGSSLTHLEEVSKEETVKLIKTLEEEIKTLEEEKKTFVTLQNLGHAKKIEEVRKVLEALQQSLKRGQPINPLELEKIKTTISSASIAEIQVQLGTINDHMKKLEQEARK